MPTNQTLRPGYRTNAGSRRSRRRAHVLLAAIVVATAPVLGSGGDARASTTAQPRVVVAVLDSGFNPYHGFFYAGSGPYTSSVPSAVTQDVLNEFGIGPSQIIEVTRTGTFNADVAADSAKWASVQRGKPYWFKGTNVIGISHRTQDWLRPSSSKSAHGVGVTAAVLNANPEAVVVLVERSGTTSEQWAHEHPAVDITTTSYGPIGSPPLPTHLGYSYTGVVRNGKLHFGAVDNTPALSPIDTTGGPWWSIGIAGWSEGGSEGREMLSGSLPDFIGDFTQALPYCMNCEAGLQSVSGTSFASPRSAGTASAILLRARRAAGHLGGIVTASNAPPVMVQGNGLSITNWRIRRALEEAAAYPVSKGYQLGDPTSAPIPQTAPWTVTGWGAITPDPARGVINETLAHLGIGGPPTRSKSSEVCTFMTAQIDARYAYWKYYAVLGEAWLRNEDPYIRCS